MQQIKLLTPPDYLTTWVALAGIIVIFTLIGWGVEQIVIRWAKRFANHVSSRERMVGRALRGHVTFWGFLLGVSLAYDTLLSIYTVSKDQNQSGLPGVLFELSTQTYTHAGLLALFIISLTFMLAGVITALIVGAATTAERPVVSLVTNVTRFIVLVLGFLVVLSVFGINLAPWLTTLGVAGLAVSLALQATLTDLVSGMLLLASHQLVVGEYVKLSTGEEGYINDITWRTTTIRQLNNNLVIVPNSKMTSLPVTNYHVETQNVGVSVELGVSYTSDLEHVEQVTIAVAQEVMRTVRGGMPDFTPTVRFTTLGDYSIRLTVNMQARAADDQDLIKHEFIKRLRSRYREEGISIPYPVQTVHLRESQDGSAATPAQDGVGGAQASANSSDASSR